MSKRVTYTPYSPFVTPKAPSRSQPLRYAELLRSIKYRLECAESAPSASQTSHWLEKACLAIEDFIASEGLPPREKP